MSARTAQQTLDAAAIESYQWTYTSTCGENSWITANPRTVHVSTAGPVLDATATLPAFQVDTATAAFLANEEGAFWPQTGWRVLEAIPETEVVLVHPGDTSNPTIALMTLSRTTSGSEWAGASSHDRCRLMYEPSRPDLSQVDWALAPTEVSLSPDSMSFTIEATERACTSGQAMGQRLNEPQLFITEDEVRLGLTADRLEGAQECPGNPSQQVEVQLPERLGDRRIVDDGRHSELGTLQPILLSLIESN